MKTGFALIGLFVCAVIPATAQRSSEVHQWAPLVRNAGDRVDIDTAAFRTRDGIRDVWLRWSGQTGPGRASVYSIERREIDCVGGRTRLLQDENIDAGPRLLQDQKVDARPKHAQRPAPQAVASLTEWYRPSAGSLVALAIGAACESGGQAGA